MTSTDAGTAEAKTGATASEYVVLREPQAGSGSHELWEKLGTYEGATAAQAIKAAAKSGIPGDGYEKGTYVAIPARSFKPVTLKTETAVKVTLS